MILSLLVCAAILQPTQPVSINYEVGRADKAVAALSKVSGVPMEARGEVASEVVFLKVGQLPLKNVMDSLARVTCAQWSQEKNGTYVLYRSPVLVAHENDKEVSRKLRALNAWRDKLVKCLQIPYNSTFLAKAVREKKRLDASVAKGNLTEKQQTQAYDRIQELTRYDPIYRALARCLKNLDLRPMAFLPSQSSFVFTLSPNAAQMPLPAGAIQATQKLQSEQLVWGKALRKLPIAKGEDPDSVFSTDSTIRFFEKDKGGSYFGADTDPWTRTLPYRLKPSLVVLTATCYSEDAYQFDLKMFTSGHELAMSFDCDDLSTFADPVGIDAKYKTPQAFAAKPSPEMKALLVRQNGTGAKVLPALQTLRRFFDDPVNNDPLWIGNQELLTALSLYRKKSVVACLPDAANQRFSDYFNLSDYSSDKNLFLTELPGRLEIRPESFADHWHHRVDRNAMVACVKSYRETGKIDLLTFVKMVANLDNEATGSYCGDFVQLSDPEYRTQYASFHIPFQSAFAPLLASLSDKQFAQIKGGKTIAYRELTAHQRSLAARIVYGVRVNIEEEMGKGVLSDVLALGPTFELPGGVLEGIGLYGEVGEDQIAVFHNGMSADHDEFYQVNLEHPAGVGFWSGPPPRVPPGGMSKATYTLHPQRYITLKCGLTPGHFIVGRFEEPMGKATGKPLLIKQLPEDIQKKLQPAVDFMKQMSKWSTGKE